MQHSLRRRYDSTQILCGQRGATPTKDTQRRSHSALCQIARINQEEGQAGTCALVTQLPPPKEDDVEGHALYSPHKSAMTVCTVHVYMAFTC